MTNDPLRYYDGLNLYEYVHGRSLLGVDPLGNLDCKVAMVNCSLAPNSKCCKKRVELTNPLGAYNHYINGDGQPATLSSGLVNDIKSLPKYRIYLNAVTSYMLTHMPTSCNQKRQNFSFTQDDIVVPNEYNVGKRYRYTDTRDINPITHLALSLTLGGFDLRFRANCYSESNDSSPKLRNGKWVCGCNARVACKIKYSLHDTYTFINTGPGLKGIADNIIFDELARKLHCLTISYFSGKFNAILDGCRNGDSLLDSLFEPPANQTFREPYEITNKWIEYKSIERWIVDRFPSLAG